MSYYHQRVAVIIPAFNEALSIKCVVDELKALKAPQNNDLPLIDDLIVACLRGIEKLSRPGQIAPSIVVFVDGDHSVDVSELETLLHCVSEGNDLVVGSRVGHKQEAQSIGAHQQFGNDLASSLIRLLWKEPISDLGPFRAIRYSALKQLDMQDQRFGWTVEMQVKAIQAGMSYKEVPVSSLRRIGVSKISGTVRGTIGAAVGIFSMVFKLYWHEAKFLASLNPVPE